MSNNVNKSIIVWKSFHVKLEDKRMSICELCTNGTEVAREPSWSTAKSPWESPSTWITGLNRLTLKTACKARWQYNQKDTTRAAYLCQVINLILYLLNKIIMALSFIKKVTKRQVWLKTKYLCLFYQKLFNHWKLPPSNPAHWYNRDSFKMKSYCFEKGTSMSPTQEATLGI